LRIILDYRPALRQRTGVGEYVHELTRALAAEGEDEIVAFSSSWKDRIDTRALPLVATVDARIPVKVLNLAWHRLQWPPVDWWTGSADVAQSAHPLLMPATGAVQAITIHDLDFLEHPERTSREIRRDYAALVHRHAARADLVVASSSHTASLIARELHVRDDRLVLCPAGAPDWPARAGNSRGEYILFVGTLEPRKNVGTLLTAYERLLARAPAAPPLHLAGRVTDAAEEWLARAGRPPLAGHVRHLGYVPPDARRELYAGAAVLVVPSLHEGFGLTALEAMTVGVPVVAAGRGALPELVGDAALLVDPDDADAIAGALELVLADSARASALSDAGRRRSAQFSWRRSAALLREAYLAALARRRSEPR
jgi:glycosyltransferase involved in cell wall biosynthesis